MMIVFSVLEFFFLGGFFAIIPFVFVMQMKSAMKIGDWQQAAEKQKNAKTALMVVAIAALVIYVLIFMATCTMGVAMIGAASTY